jgi:hypothetical protein
VEVVNTGRAASCGRKVASRADITNFRMFGRVADDDQPTTKARLDTSKAHALTVGFQNLSRICRRGGAIDTAYMDAIERIGSATCDGTVTRMAANIPGSAPGVTSSASITPFCHTLWPVVRRNSTASRMGIIHEGWQHWVTSTPMI